MVLGLVLLAISTFEIWGSKFKFDASAASRNGGTASAAPLAGSVYMDFC
jgi:hypothetical protein